MTDLSLLQDFVTETVEHLEEMEGNLLQLESDPENRETLNNIFRSVHTIKGAAEYLGMEHIAELSHKLENLLDQMRQHERMADREVLDLLMAARDRIGILAADLHQTQAEQTEIGDLLERIQSLGTGPKVPAEEKAVRPDPSAPAARPDGQADDAATGTIYEEEHDEEFFGIFLEQLQEGLEALQSWTDALAEADNTDRIEILGRCLAQIDPLCSSANYMGYGKLTTLYDEWTAVIQNARERLDGDDDAFLTGFIHNDMQANIAEIAAVFPRLKPPRPASVPAPAEATAKEHNLIDTLDDDSESDTDTAPLPDLPDDTGLDLFVDGTDDTPSEQPQASGNDIPGTDEKDNNLDLALLQDFIAETIEHLGEMETGLLQLATQPDNQDILNDIFRSVHTIKGAAEYLGMSRIAELSHRLENLLDALRHNVRTASRPDIDLLMAARDRIGILTADLHQTQSEQAEIQDLLYRIASLLEENADTPETKTALPATEAGGLPPETETGDLPVSPTNENDIYEEEHDEELFGIFLEQLQEGLEALQSWTAALAEADQTDRIEILGRCLGQIDPLRSSANYMGYRKLTGLYDRWTDAIQTARERLNDNDAQFMPAFIAGCMQATIDDIGRCFPRLERKTTNLQPGEAADNDHHPGIDAGMHSDLSPGLSDTLAEAAQTRQTDTSSSAVLASEGESLFDRLSQSFDQRMAENQSIEPDTTASGMELELFSEDRQTDADTQSAFSNRWEADADDPLTAYVDAPDTPTPAFLAEEVMIDDRPPAPAASPPDDAPVTSRDVATEELPETAEAALEDDFLYIAPDESTEMTLDDTVEVAGDVSPDEAVFWQSSSEEQASEEAIMAAPVAADIPTSTTPPLPDAAASEFDQRSGDRRDPERRGRRQSDRMNEQLLKQSIRVDAGKIDDLMNQVGELVVSRAWFSQLFHEMRDLQQNLQHRADIDPREMKQVKGLTFRLSEATVALGRVANELQEGVMKVRMLPIAQLFNRYPRLVFDLVRDSDKNVKLDIKGEETELDKMVIEAISDPLIHIIRNAVDHGIESSAERQRHGKSETGTIHLEAYHEGNHVVIEIADDGRGLDIERIKAKAVSGKFASRDEIERMSLKEITGLIMQPGFSTAAEITHTSGRGVGMDVVKQNIEKLNGTIEIDTNPGHGTRFRIKIPLTLAIIPALLVSVRSELFTIPLSTVEETIRIAYQDLSTIEGVEVMQLRESTLPLVRLADLFNMPARVSDDGRAFVVVVSTGMKRVGLVVDALLGQEEVVIKPLEDYLQEKSGFSGATILGDGRISLILDIYELVNLSIDRQAQRKQVAAPL